MAIRDKQGRWISAAGKAVPVKNVRPADREKDRLVESIYGELKAMQADMERKKAAILARIEDYKNLLEDEFDASFGAGGNLTLTNYSGNKQVEIKVNKQIHHDEKLHLAEGLMREALNEMIDELRGGSKAGSEPTALRNIIGIVDHAFALTETGHVARHRIVQLKQVEVDHPKWRRALALIDESEVVRGTKQYLHLRERATPEQRFQTVPLNFSVI